jgi:hypothetical protein
LELFSLEEKVAQLPGGLFVFITQSASILLPVLSRHRNRSLPIISQPDRPGNAAQNLARMKTGAHQERPSEITGADDRN